MVNEIRKSALKFSFTWVIIMLTVNLFYAGYSITERSDINSMTSVQLYNVFFETQSTAETSIISINNSATVNPSDINGNQEGYLSYILDILDTIYNYAKFVTFIVGFLTLGGLFLAWDILNETLITNVWIKLIISTFLIIGNVVMGILMFRLVMNKGRDD